jgi:hypothetical protein
MYPVDRCPTNTLVLRIDSDRAVDIVTKSVIGIPKAAAPSALHLRHGWQQTTFVPPMPIGSDWRSYSRPA